MVIPLPFPSPFNFGSTSQHPPFCFNGQNEDCDFETEPKAQFHCEVEHASRMVYATWVRPGAKVLEVGARYGHATCMLSKVLGLDEEDRAG